MGDKFTKTVFFSTKQVSGASAFLEKIIFIKNRAVYRITENDVLDKIAELNEKCFKNNERKLRQLQLICFCIKVGEPKCLTWARFLACDFSEDFYHISQHFEAASQEILKYNDDYLFSANLKQLSDLYNKLKDVYLDTKKGLSDPDHNEQTLYPSLKTAEKNKTTSVFGAA